MTGITRTLARTGAPIMAITMVGLAGVAPSAAQGTAADYERARSLKATYENAAGVVAEPATWIETTSRFWYRRAVPGGNEFVVVDAATRAEATGLRPRPFGFRAVRGYRPIGTRR